MPVVSDVRAPWDVSLGVAQHELIFYSLVVAGLALFAQFVRTWVSTNEVGARYRTSLYASLCVTGVAFLAYVYLVVKFDSSYVLRGTSYVPTAEARNSYVPRYMDWSVTVPLLMVELLGVGALVGAKARSMRAVLVSSAFLMIFTGFLGAAVIGGGTSSAALLIWGIISTVFYVVLYVLLFGMLRSARGAMGEQAYASYRNGMILLLSVWGWYPIAYAIHNWYAGSTATTVIQVGFSFADIAAKVGLGALIHKVAKLRTAEDVNKGEETHPEDVWVSSVKHSGGVQPALKGISAEGAQHLREHALAGAPSLAGHSTDGHAELGVDGASGTRRGATAPSSIPGSIPGSKRPR